MDRPSWPPWPEATNAPQWEKRETTWHGLRLELVKDYIGFHVSVYRGQERIYFGHGMNIRSAKYQAEGAARDALEEDKP